MLVKVPIVRLPNHIKPTVCEPNWVNYENPYYNGSREYMFLQALYALHAEMLDWIAQSGVNISLCVQPDTQGYYGDVDVVIDEEHVAWYIMLVDHRVAAYYSQTQDGPRFTTWVREDLTKAPYTDGKELNTKN